MLNRAVGGAFGYTTDIGGYLDRFNPPADLELFTRWSERAALTPYFRVHESQTSGTRMPWSYDEPTYARWLALARLHDRAVALIRRRWREGAAHGRAADAAAVARRARGARRAPRGPEPAARRRRPRRAGRDPRRDAALRRVPPRLLGAAGRARPPAPPRPARATVDAPVGRLPYFFRCGERPF